MQKESLKYLVFIFPTGFILPGSAKHHQIIVSYPLSKDTAHVVLEIKNKITSNNFFCHTDKKVVHFFYGTNREHNQINAIEYYKVSEFLFNLMSV